MYEIKKTDGTFVTSAKLLQDVKQYAQHNVLRSALEDGDYVVTTDTGRVFAVITLSPVGEVIWVDVPRFRLP